MRFVRDNVATVSLDLSAAMNAAGPFRRDADRVEFALAPPPKAGESRQFSIRYRGKPASGLKILKNAHGDRCFFSSNWPDRARQWLPTVDHPYDKASGEFIVTAPARYQVVANGALVEQRELAGGRRLTHWKQSAPIATWLFNIGVAQFAYRQFATVAGVPLQTWVFPQDRDLGPGTFDDAARRAMEFFAREIGPYPYEKLAHVQGSRDRRGRHGARQRDLLRREGRHRASRLITWSRMRPPISGSATPSPRRTGTTSGSAKASPPIWRLSRQRTTTAPRPSVPP